MKSLRTYFFAAGARVACAAMLLAALAVSACNVPVFRYALERWPPENYHAFLFHRGALTSAERQQVAVLTNSIHQLRANVALKLVDLAESHGMDEQKLWRTQTNALLPWLVLAAPESEDNESATEPTLWSGRLDDAKTGGLFDSPARQELAQRLLSGDSVVWLMIDSGDAAQDGAISSLLTNELRRLQSTLKLPPPAADDPAPRLALPLRIGFTIQHLARTARGEEFFLRTLLHGETVVPDKPIVVPIFGRARALTALSGFELSPNVFSQAAAFLCGACSCEVKELNPGKDLLVAANWEAAFTAAAPEASTPGIAAGERVVIAPGNEAALAAAAPVRPIDVPNERRGMKMLASVTLAFVCIIVLILGVVMLRSLRKH